MKPVFEYSDTLNNPYEAFFFDAQVNSFPITPHWHYFMEIIYMVKGSAYMESGKDNYVLEPGDLIVFHPQTPHAIYSTGHFPIHYYVLKFDPIHLNIPGSSLPATAVLLEMVRANASLPSYFAKEHFTGLPLQKLFKMASDVLGKKEFGYDIMAHSYFSLIIAELLRIWKKLGFTITAASKHSSVNEKFAAVSEYIITHYSDSLMVEELADQVHMSYSHFAKLFKEYYGQSCNHFIQMVRIQKAEDLLRFTDYDLSYISQETGFSDCSHFIRVFKEFHGITPRQFRLKA